MIVLNVDGKFEVYEGSEGYNRLIMLPKGKTSSHIGLHLGSLVPAVGGLYKLKPGKDFEKCCLGAATFQELAVAIEKLEVENGCKRRQKVEIETSVEM